MKWEKYRIKTTTQAEDFVSSMLADFGIAGVEIEDNTPLTEQETARMFIDIPPELPQDDGTSYLTFYLEADGSHEELLDRIRRELEDLREVTEIGDGTISVSQTEDQDWANNWKQFFHSFYVGDIFIRPTWEKEEPKQEARTVIEIDPGISFGTGKHETTQLCIRELDRYVRPDSRVLDLGCGSGILSIVALKLGAGHVHGTDIDEDCIRSTYDNFAVNHLTKEQGTFEVGNLITDRKLQQRLGQESYDIVVANILADVLIPMAPYLPACLKPQGILICSGIIDFKENAVKEAVEASGLSVVRVGHQGEWVSVTAVKE
jgi:ribosomal protein L11 methyltransferase